MMWWVNKFGRVTGPYSDEQIRSGIRQNQFTRLNKISNDQQTWMRLDQTKFWQPVSSAPESMTTEANPFETGAAPGKLRRPSAMPTPGPTPFRRPAPAPEPEESVPPLQQTPPLSARFDLNQKTSGGEGGKNRKWLWIGGGIAACFAAVLVAGVLAIVGKHSTGDAVKSVDDIQPIAKASESVVSNALPRFATVKKRVVLVHTKEGVGTGFLVKMDGKKYVMSNDHVVRSSSTPEMVLVDGTKLKLGAFSTASDRDLARFEVLDYNGDCFEFAKTSPNNGDEVWVYGNSSGDDVITSLKGHVTGVGSKVVKVDAEFVQGNSGSPILDKNGKVIAVAAYLKNGSEGKDWTKKGTQFDDVRRFGIRLTNVEWVNIDRKEYEKECARLAEMAVYWNYLVDYLICLDVSDERYKTLTLEHKDVYKKSFRGADGAGFHEMLTEVSKSYARQGSSWRKWQTLVKDRGALIDDLSKRVDGNELTLENAQKALAEFDASKKVDKTWENVKAKHRDFNAKRKEALLMAQGFLTKNEWRCPLIRHGHSKDDNDDSVDWYLERIQYGLDQNAQELKDLNKQLRTLEGKEDEE